VPAAAGASVWESAFGWAKEASRKVSGKEVSSMTGWNEPPGDGVLTCDCIGRGSRPINVMETTVDSESQAEE